MESVFPANQISVPGTEVTSAEQCQVLSVNSGYHNLHMLITSSRRTTRRRISMATGAETLMENPRGPGVTQQTLLSSGNHASSPFAPVTHQLVGNLPVRQIPG